jgi:hypothetical protein
MRKCHNAFLALSLLAVTGCASSRNRQPRAVNGTYKFIEQVHDAVPPVQLEGTVTIDDGEVELDLLTRQCRHDHRSTTRTAVFNCLDVSVSVDRSSPMPLGSFRLETTVLRAVRECVHYYTTSTGVTMCALHQTRYEERDTTRSGILRLARIVR